MAAEHTNPFLQPYGTQFNIPPFEKITYDDYLPAVKQGIAERKQEIDAIVKNRATPDFDNTILALEKSGQLLQKVMLVFSSLDETNSSPEMVKLSEIIYPMTSEASDEVMMNDGLFKKVKYVYDNREKMGLTGDKKRAVEETYKSFVREGALLSPEKKEEHKKQH